MVAVAGSFPTHTRGASRDASSARSAELLIDGQGLLVPHQHIHSVEPILDLERVPGAAAVIGELTVADHRWPIYSLDRNLDVLSEIPTTRRAAVLLRNPRGNFGILCDEVHVVDNASLRMVPIPGCMQGAHSLMDALAVLGSKVTCVLSVQRLAAMLHPDERFDDHGRDIDGGMASLEY